MKGKVERFFTRNGFKYKFDISHSIINTNYTLGLCLRKIYAINENGDCTYALKQTDYKRILYNIIYNKFSSVKDRPIYALYKNNIKIGHTGHYSNGVLPIETSEFKLKLVKIIDKRNHIIQVIDGENIIAKIIKNKLRYGKKNIYELVYDNWNYDKDLLMLITVLCDVVFFPEWRMLKWSYMEYDIN